MSDGKRFEERLGGVNEEKRKSECRIYERCCGSERLAGK